MSSFSFNLHAWVFHDGLSSIEKSFEAAQAALSADILQARTNIDDYATALAAGAPYEEERDEDGHLVATREQLLDYHHSEAVSAAAVLRKAYVVVLYHHWERNALKWVDKAHLKHDALVDAIKGKGYTVADDLKILYMLCNLLKHNNGKWGHRLAGYRSDFFVFNRAPADGIRDWEPVVVVGEHHVRGFIEIVRQSGPELGLTPV